MLSPWNKGVPLLGVHYQFLVIVKVTPSQFARTASILLPEERPAEITAPLICDEGDIDPKVFTPEASAKVRRWMAKQRHLPYHSYMIALCSRYTDLPTGDNVLFLDNLW